MKKLAKIFTIALLLVATFVAQAQTTWIVTNAGDGAAGTINGTGTLRNTIAAAANGDIITFSPAIDNVPIVLNSALSITDKSIRIIGNGVKKTVINSNYTITFTPTSISRDLLLSNLTLQTSLTINALATFTLHTCVFDGTVSSTNPLRFNVTQSTFTNPNSFLVTNLGATPSQGMNPYQVSYCLFTQASPYNSSTSAMGIYLMKDRSAQYPCIISFTECEFKNNTTNYGAIFTVRVDNVVINKCTFDNNKVVSSPNISASAICMLEKGLLTVMNSIFRGNGAYNTSVVNNNLIFVGDWITQNFGVTLEQNQITGNSGADIRIDNLASNTANLLLRQNTIANNSSALIKSQNLQVANSYLETTFNTVNTPVSLGGNYFRNAVAWAASSDIVHTVVSFPATPAPIFVAPVTSIPSTGGNYRLATNSILIGSAINNQVPQDIFDYDGDGNITETVPFDIVGNPRRFDRGVDIGAYERQANGGGLRAENTEETLTNNSQTLVYPNPANEVLNINYELSTGADKAEVLIVNTIGQAVYQTTVNAASKAMKVDVSNFEKGLYVIRIVDNEGNIQNHKVIVK